MFHVCFSSVCSLGRLSNSFCHAHVVVFKVSFGEGSVLKLLSDRSNTESVSEEENLCRYALSEVMSPSSEASTSDSERERCQSPCVLNDQLYCGHYAITRFITTSIPTTSHVRCHVMKRTPKMPSSQWELNNSESLMEFGFVKSKRYSVLEVMITFNTTLFNTCKSIVSSMQIECCTNVLYIYAAAYVPYTFSLWPVRCYSSE